MSSSRQGRGRGRGGFMPSGPLAQRGRGRGRGDSPQGSDRDNSPRGREQNSGSSGKSPPAVYGDKKFPYPSKDVEEFEEKYLNDYGGKREELDKELGNAMMPYRPAYGREGEEVILWANYFHLGFKGTEELFKYEVVITDPRKRSSNNNEDDGKVTGRKAMHIFKAFIDQVRRTKKGSVFATDAKQKIVATTSLKPLPETFGYPCGQGEISLQYDLKISEQVIHVGNLDDVLKTQAQTPGFIPSHNPDSKYNGFPFHQDIIDAMGIITGHAPRASRSIVNVGRSRFFSKENAELSSKIGSPKILQISKGFSQSVKPATGRLLLNVNVTHSIFRPAGRISELFDRLPGQFQEKAQKLHKIVSKARIKYTPPAKKGDQPAKKGDQPSKEMTIAGLGRDTDHCSKQEENPKFPYGKRFGNAHEVQFCLKKKLPTDTIPVHLQGLQWDKYYSVYDYFYRKYQYQPKSKFPVVNLGRPTDPIYVPAECCELLGFDPIRCELSAKESEDMIEFAVKTPQQNATWISGPGRTDVLKLTSDIALLKDFGVDIESQLITVKGRQLSLPQLLYNTPSEHKARVVRNAESGSWNLRADRAGLRFHTRGKPINRWAWIFFSLNEDDRTKFKDCVENFKNYVAELGVRIVNEAVHPTGTVVPYREGDSMEAIYGNIQTEVEKENLEFALVILPDTKADIYTAVKLVGDIKLGFHTVCVTADNFCQDLLKARGLYANLATKINLKFGGVNHAICSPYQPFERDKTMIVGYDVVHPTGQAGNVGASESQVGLVASIGQEFGQWRSRYWTQAARQEILDGKLVEEFKDQLNFYKAKERGALPVNILIYRDGVSEGQYLQVLKEELPNIVAACGKVYEQAGKESPSITLVVSVKRHATRFFPTSLTKMENSMNIKAGTVVDRGVTQARCWDFYLKSHTALQGTARPTHYVVLHDEIFRPQHLEDLPKPVSASSALAVGKSSADDLEAVTHQLCYLYGRATKAISICTPARYADIVCTRARLHASGLARLASRPGLTLKGKSEILGMPVHENLRDTMYWI